MNHTGWTINGMGHTKTGLADALRHSGKLASESLRRMLLALFLFCLSAAGLFGQTRALSKDVRELVSVDAPVVVLRHVRVVDGTGAPPRDDQTVVISGGKIETIGPTATTTSPSGAREIDLSDRTVIPGLVGMHDHLFYPAPSSSAPAVGGSLALYHELGFSFPRLYLAGGVTTIRTTGSIEPQTDLELAKAIDAGRIAGPKIHVTAPYLEGVGSYTPQMHELFGPEDARRTVDYWAEEGATSFKAYMHITRAELRPRSRPRTPANSRSPATSARSGSARRRPWGSTTSSTA